MSCQQRQGRIADPVEDADRLGGEINQHIKQYGRDTKHKAIAEGVARSVGDWLHEHGPDTATEVCKDVGGWASVPHVRGLAMSHHYFDIVGWRGAAESLVPVLGLSELGRRACERDWPLCMADGDRDLEEKWIADGSEGVEEGQSGGETGSQFVLGDFGGGEA